MNRLGQLRHPNLVPLLGFCAVEEERLLVYKHMPGGDVYAFGVVLLELVTGQKPLDVNNGDEGGFKGNLVDWVNQLVITGRTKDCIDKSLVGRGHDDDMSHFLKVALNCVGSRPKDRLAMYQVYESLKGLAEKHGMTEQYDHEFPLAFGKQVVSDCKE
ncbi:unnamed protein product [Linum tenue]|uniref:Protein kinase domain-containing protein n=1 Tax=Linum tenue TaxID=586396 RepID=A0AAV0HN03_9ROSI|nr:unnamed protein product [Linum tenue]